MQKVANVSPFFSNCSYHIVAIIYNLEVTKTVFLNLATRLHGVVQTGWA